MTCSCANMLTVASTAFTVTMVLAGRSTCQVYWPAPVLSDVCLGNDSSCEKVIEGV